MTDKMVLRTQQWLNQTYSGDSRFNKVAEDGQTNTAKGRPAGRRFTG